MKPRVPGEEVVCKLNLISIGILLNGTCTLVLVLDVEQCVVGSSTQTKPSGAGEHAKAIRCASFSPSNFCGLADSEGFLALKAASRPSSKDKELELRTGLSADEIEKTASRASYKQHVKDLMFKERDAEGYKEWVIKEDPVWLSKRMRLCQETITELINAVAEKHGIDLSELKGSLTPRRKNTIPNPDLEPERTIGSGNSSVYLYYYPQYQESAEAKGEKVWECKIGRTMHGEADGRIRGQATGLPENPKIGLHIKTDKEAEIERIIHDILKVRGKHKDDTPGREWFLTSPSEVEEIYKFIEE